jgi:hypothetical protein
VKTSILKVTLHFTSTLFSALKKVPAQEESQKLELEILEYHTRAMATTAGIIELENTY